MVWLWVSTPSLCNTEARCSGCITQRHSSPAAQLTMISWAWHLCVLCAAQDVLEVVTLGELLPQLAYHLQTCLHRQQW